MRLLYELNDEEIGQEMRLIGETVKLGSRPLSTGRGKRLYRAIISEEEDELAQRMIDRCRYVHSHGIKGTVTLTSEEARMIGKLVKVCMSL